MDKKQIGSVLEEIGEILEILGENPFKVRAYHNAARVIGSLSEDLGNLIRSDSLTTLGGIGKNLAEHIRELYETGKLKEYEKIRKSVPDGVLKMLRIRDLGPKRVKLLWEELGTTSLEKLESACIKGKVASLKGFGLAMQRKIFEGIALHKTHLGQFLYSVAYDSAEQILESIRNHPEVERAEIAGSLRRRRETVKDIDMVASTEVPQEVMKAFITLPLAEKIVQQGETKSAIFLKTGLQADLRLVREEEFPYALLHFTGSKEHNVQLRSLAQKKGLKLNEYGLFRGEKNIPCKNEEAVFVALGLSYIPPELREGLSEIELARKGKIPKLIEEGDIQGIFHCHSTWSDGMASIEEMVRRAKKLGLKYYGVADHSQASAHAGGLNPQRIREQHKEIDRLNKKIDGIHIFKGIEADILPTGEVDMGDEVLGSLDYVVASVHSGFTMPKNEMTKRIVKALKNKHVRMLGHMTGRLLLSRVGYEVNAKEIIDAASDYGVAIEINSQPLRLDIDWRHIPYAREKGVTLVINPDAHSLEGIGYYRFGVGIARKGGVTKDEVLNTRSLHEVKQWLKV